MSILNNTTIRHKLTLIIMFTCITTLVMAASAFIVWEQITFRNSMARNLSIQAAMTADNCKAALAFEDAADAEETLKALRAEPSIIFGCVYTADEKIFAKYSRPNSSAGRPLSRQSTRLFTRQSAWCQRAEQIRAIFPTISAREFWCSVARSV